MNLPICLLVDNGSLRPEAIFSLRRVAQKLSLETSFNVIPLGLLHSNKVDPALLDGVSGETIGTFLSDEHTNTQNELMVLPFFFGPSRGITEWLIEKLEDWKSRDSTRSYRVLDPLFKGNELQLAQALQDEIENTSNLQSPEKYKVALVDHGTPVQVVNQVREAVGDQLKDLLSEQVIGFSTCSMERREGDEYSFNDPLLENLLIKWAEGGANQVIVALFFLLSGRHAGKEGDLAEICAKVKKQFPAINILLTNPLGEHEIIFKILCERLHASKN